MKLVSLQKRGINIIFLQGITRALSSRIRFSFFFPVCPTVHTYVFGEFCHRKCIFSKTFSRVEILKKPASRLLVDGRKRRFSNTMMSYIMFFQHDACSVRYAIVFPSFQRFHVDGRKRFEYAKCGWVFFFSLENGEKDLRFEKNLNECGRGLIQIRFLFLCHKCDINVMTSRLFTKFHDQNIRNKSTIVFQKCILNNRQSLIRCWRIQRCRRTLFRGLNVTFNIYQPTDSDCMSSSSLKQSLNCCLRGINYIFSFFGMKILLYIMFFSSFRQRFSQDRTFFVWQNCNLSCKIGESKKNW